MLKENATDFALEKHEVVGKHVVMQVYGAVRDDLAVYALVCLS